jgi:hypothetical protein
MKKFFFIALLLPQVLFAQIQIIHQSVETDEYFTIVNQKLSASIYFDTADNKAVHKTAQLFTSDIEMISDKKLLILTDSKKLKGNIIIVGTIGKNQLIDRLIAEKRLIVDSIQNQWERFIIQTIDKPFKGVKKALVIAGSDRRGTSYGTFTLSEKLGVSPWYWWADVPVKKKKELYVKNISYISKAPSVKYRGIFLNDEDWGLHPWAAKNIDPEVGDIGPKTYEKIFELLLRLKANMVAPAMHECTKAFYTVPGNMEMADTYGIMVTTSHCEPLLYNNASEWNKKTQGEWNYATNKAQIVEVLDNRIKQAHENENIYTIALRGMHDEGMKGGSDEEKLKMLDEAIKDQRSILSKYIDKPLSEIPQIFVPYKEVLGLYEKGLEIPEEITIVWPDDNYGYIKKLSNPEEQNRKGGSGVYYHLSYLGWPNDYLWLNTTPAALMYAEMQKAYSLGSDKYWLLNVGDIKPGEMGMQLFLDMAWDFSQFSFENINQYQVEKLSSFFGNEYKEQLDIILDRYYYHGFTRKPEYMTWDWRWNSIFEFEDIKDTEFSFINYNEAENRLAEYNKISEMAKTIMNELPKEEKAAFFELVYYPVKGASLYNHEMLTGQKNRWYASQGRALTNVLANDVKLYHDSLASLTAEYNNILNGKWNGMMTAPGFLPKVQLSPTKTIELPDSSGMALFVEGQSSDSAIDLALPKFNSLFNETYFFEVYNTGNLPFTYQAKTTSPWILLDKKEGDVKEQLRINVSIDWHLIHNDTEVNGEIIVSNGNTTKNILVSAVRPEKNLKNVFIENNGVISIRPTDFQRKTEKGDIKFQPIEGLGYSNASLQLGSAKYDSGDRSFVEYDFFTTYTGEITIYTYMLPLFAKDKSQSTQYGVQVDSMDMVLHHNNVKEYSKEWAGNVIRNSAINKTNVFLKKPGKHALKIYCIDPGMIIQKILIDTGGLKESYLAHIIGYAELHFVPVH